MLGIARNNLLGSYTVSRPSCRSQAQLLNKVHAKKHKLQHDDEYPYENVNISTQQDIADMPEPEAQEIPLDVVDKAILNSCDISKRKDLSSENENKCLSCPQLTFENVIIAHMQKHCGDVSQWNACQNIIELFMQGPYATEWKKSRYNAKQLAKFIRNRKRKLLKSVTGEGILPQKKRKLHQDPDEQDYFST